MADEKDARIVALEEALAEKRELQEQAWGDYKVAEEALKDLDIDIYWMEKQDTADRARIIRTARKALRDAMDALHAVGEVPKPENEA